MSIGQFVTFKDGSDMYIHFKTILYIAVMLGIVQKRRQINNANDVHQSNCGRFETIFLMRRRRIRSLNSPISIKNCNGD